jgi:acyl carrier protein phosphodiesterase
MVYFANFYFEQKQYEKAEPLAKRAVEINDKTLPPNHPDRITAMENYVALLRYLNRPAEADAIERRLKAQKRREAK